MITVRGSQGFLSLYLLSAANAQWKTGKSFVKGVDQNFSLGKT